MVITDCFGFSDCWASEALNETFSLKTIKVFFGHFVFNLRSFKGFLLLTSKQLLWFLKRDDLRRIYFILTWSRIRAASSGRVGGVDLLIDLVVDLVELLLDLLIELFNVRRSF